LNSSDLLTDKPLCALSFFLILLWLGVKYRLYSLPKLESETAAATLLRIACGFLLAGASLDKVGDATHFLNLIKECYFFIPDALQPLTAVVIPWVEFFTGLCLLLGFRWRAAIFIFCVLMTVYMLAITWDVLHHIDCACNCFDKKSTEKMSWWTVLRDALFLGMGWIVLSSPKTYLTSENGEGPRARS
jgi:uncharacterized membrane protein YphA (DoxX/SURF4 family)